MPTEEITFASGDGRRLNACLELPADGSPSAYAVFAHGFTHSGQARAAVHISRTLAENHIAVLRFDSTGFGESDGDFAEGVVAAAALLAETREAPKLLVGHAFGGAAVLYAARRIPSAVAIATIAAPADAPDLADAVRELDAALLLFHSPSDSVIDIDNAATIYTAASHPKSFVSVDEADHLLSDPMDSEYVATMLAAWSSRYIPLRRSPVAPERSEGEVVACIGAEGLRTALLASGHSLVADEPAAVGGSNAGPTPYDLVLAGLGACTAMTLRLYADRKEWPLDEVEVRLTHERLHRRDEPDDDGGARLDRIERRVALLGELSEEQRARLLEIADRCPVHRTLTAGVDIITDSRRD